MSDSLEEFLSFFIDDHYIDEISHLLSLDRNYVEVDYQLLYIDNPEYAINLLSEHRRILPIFDALFTEKLRMISPEYVNNINKVRTRIVNLIETTPIRCVDSKRMGHLIQVEGTVIQRGKPLVRVTDMAFRCGSCDRVTMVKQNEQYRKHPPPCDCGNSKWKHDYKHSLFQNYQEIVIQEYMENTENGGSPDKVKIILTDNLIRSCEPGENTVIVGVLQAYDSSPKSRRIELDYHIDANNLINVTDANTITLTETDEQNIQRLMEDPNHKTRIIKSIAPTIYGLDSIKEALAYQQCEGQVKHVSKTRKRGQFHILLAGPPGCGKSELGDFMVKCHPKGRKSIGRGASGVGLTASVVKDGEQFVLKAGAMALADNGFLFVDELEKMNPSDSGAMHPGMEQQEINIDKADISAVLKTRCSVLGACNPLDGIWNEYKTLIDNLYSKGRGLALPLLDRFALIFVIKQNQDTELEEEVIDHIMKINLSPDELVPPYDIDTLRKIFAYARKINVEMMPEITKRLSDFYMTLYETSKKNDVLIITRRQPEDLVRLTEASARLHGRHIATLLDAENAINIVATSLRQYGIDPSTGQIDQTTAFYGKPKTMKDRIAELPTIVERLCERNIDATRVSRITLVKYLVNLWRVDENEVARILEVCLRDGFLYCPTPHDIAVSTVNVI